MPIYQEARTQIYVKHLANNFDQADCMTKRKLSGEKSTNCRKKVAF